jgi:hypothetical protein
MLIRFLALNFACSILVSFVSLVNLCNLNFINIILYATVGSNGIVYNRKFEDEDILSPIFNSNHIFAYTLGNKLHWNDWGKKMTKNKWVILKKKIKMKRWGNKMKRDFFSPSLWIIALRLPLDDKKLRKQHKKSMRGSKSRVYNLINVFLTN